MKKRVHKTSKNTVAKPPITRLAEYTMEVNGVFTIVTDLMDSKVFDKVYRQWFDDPKTFMWCGSSLVEYIKDKFPNSICLLKEDYDRITKGKVINATKEDWLSENN